MIETQKADVRTFWSRESCGEIYAQGDSLQEQLAAQSRLRYELEPFIPDFARFDDARGKRVLEIGVGMGADHMQWAINQPAMLAGLDLTGRAVEFTRERLSAAALSTNLSVADAEDLPFEDDSFDVVYSWGVLHHSPDTPKAITEARRVLRKGGRAAVMIYHRESIVGFLLWMRYGMLRGLSLADVYSRYLESPGTKAYSVSEALALFKQFSTVDVAIALSPGDLMTGAAGQRHRGVLLKLAKRVWPRPLIRTFGKGSGLFLMITAIK